MIFIEIPSAAQSAPDIKQFGLKWSPECFLLLQVWNRPLLNLEVVLTNLRSVFSRAYYLVCTRKDLEKVSYCFLVPTTQLSAWQRDCSLHHSAQSHPGGYALVKQIIVNGNIVFDCFSILDERALASLVDLVDLSAMTVAFLSSLSHRESHGAECHAPIQAIV